MCKKPPVGLQLSHTRREFKMPQWWALVVLCLWPRPHLMVSLCAVELVITEGGGGNREWSTGKHKQTAGPCQFYCSYIRDKSDALKLKSRLLLMWGGGKRWHGWWWQWLWLQMCSMMQVCLQSPLEMCSLLLLVFLWGYTHTLRPFVHDTRTAHHI